MGQIVSRIDAVLQKPARKGSLSSQNDEQADSALGYSEPKSPAFQWLDGRGFNVMGNPTYILPNDTTEYIRLNSQHYLFRFLFQGNFQAPMEDLLKEGIKVLDAGCGTGIWAAELAAEFPKSNFTGTDIVDIFQNTTAPNNCTFVIADTLKGLPFIDDTFDYVFQRAQVICYTKQKWPDVIKELIRVTKPGGIIELFDGDVFIHDAGPATAELIEKLHIMLMMRDVDNRFISQLRPVLKSAGLVAINHMYRSIPVGWGHERLGIMCKDNMIKAFEAFKPKMLLSLGISEAEYEPIAKQAAEEMNGKCQGYMNVEVYWGRKPTFKL